MKSDKPDHYDNIDEIYETIWNLLDKGKKDINSAFHQAYLATHSDHYPSIRTIVLRNVNMKDKIFGPKFGPMGIQGVLHLGRIETQTCGQGATLGPMVEPKLAAKDQHWGKWWRPEGGGFG